MPAALLTIELRLPLTSSLKDKRAAVKPILDRARSRFNVAAAELAYQDVHRRARLGFAAVSASQRQVEEVLDAVERLVWSRPDTEIVGAERRWLEEDD